jgi:hypothetical protein
LLLKGMTAYSIRNEIYPDSSDPFNAIKRTLKNQNVILEAEKQRISKLPEGLKQTEENNIRTRLSHVLKLG